jgi:hypothetical protein
MEKRREWREVTNTLFHFKWAPFSNGINFDLLNQNGLVQLVNHFKNHYEITNKECLFKNLLNYCEVSANDVA